MGRRLEITANIAIIVLAVMLGVVVVRERFSAHSPKSRETILVGHQLAIQGVAWGEGQTLVLALRSDCHFCTESAPFYHGLTAYAASRHIKTVAVLPDSLDTAQRYLAEHSVAVNETVRSPLAQLGISGTPTILLVDHSGKVTKAWLGMLPKEAETDVMNSL